MRSVSASSEPDEEAGSATSGSVDGGQSRCQLCTHPMHGHYLLLSRRKTGGGLQEDLAPSWGMAVVTVRVSGCGTNSGLRCPTWVVGHPFYLVLDRLGPQPLLASGCPRSWLVEELRELLFDPATETIRALAQTGPCAWDHFSNTFSFIMQNVDNIVIHIENYNFH
jgi:hypothetical protein